MGGITYKVDTHMTGVPFIFDSIYFFMFAICLFSEHKIYVGALIASCSDFCDFLSLIKSLGKTVVLI